EAAASGRAVLVAPGLRRGRRAEGGDVGRTRRDRRHLGALIRYGVRERDGVAAAAGVEARAVDVRDEHAGRIDDVTAVAGGVRRREVEEAAAVAAGRADDRAGARSRGGLPLHEARLVLDRRAAELGALAIRG